MFLMTKKEIDIQKALGTYLPLKWNERQKLRTESKKLYAEGDKLHTENNKLYAEGDRLYAKAGKLHIESKELYIEAVIEVYGPKAIINWDTGEVRMK